MARPCGGYLRRCFCCSCLLPASRAASRRRRRRWCRMRSTTSPETSPTTSPTASASASPTRTLFFLFSPHPPFISAAPFFAADLLNFFPLAFLISMDLLMIFGWFWCVFASGRRIGTRPSITPRILDSCRTASRRQEVIEFKFS